MHIDWYFSIANSLFENADYIIFGIPYDSTQSFKSGSRFAPNAIREASWNLESYSQYFSYNLDYAKVCDSGNINCDGSFEDIEKRILDFLERVETVPIAIGGEHIVSYAVVEDFENVCYLSFDAHFDLRDEFDGTKYSHACTLRRVYELGFDIVLIGVRSGLEDEKRFADENGIKYYYSWEILEKGVNFIVDDLLKYDAFYLSLDVDVFDPAFAPGVSTPEPFGLHPIHFLKILEKISKKVVGLDIVEVIPDSEKITQTLAAKLIIEFIAAREREIKT